MHPTEARDQETSIADLRQAVKQFIDARQWEPYHTPKNVAMSIAIEAAEIMEHFQWLTPGEAYQKISDPAARAEVADELADVIIYCLSLANVAGIEVSASVYSKLARNEIRFPPGPEPDLQIST